MRRQPTDYDAIADAYAAVADELPGNKHYERPATIALLPSLAGRDVLDAGCGGGFYTKLAADRGARVVGYDPSAEMLRHAKARVGDGAELHHCTTAELEEKVGGRTFDIILSCMVLHYVRALDLEARLLAARLRPGGTMVVSMKHPLISQRFISEHGYRATGTVTNEWNFGSVTQVQRPLGRITLAWYRAGLLIERLAEPFPRPRLAGALPAEYENAMKRWPLFVHFVLRKPPVIEPAEDPENREKAAVRRNRPSS